MSHSAMLDAPLLTVEGTGIAACKKAAAAIIAYLAETATLRDVYLVSRWTYYVNGQAMGRAADTNVYLQDTRTHTLSFAENAAVVERGLDQTLSALKQMGRRAHIVIRLPESFHNVPANMARNLWLGRRCRSADTTGGPYLLRRPDDSSVGSGPETPRSHSRFADQLYVF